MIPSPVEVETPLGLRIRLLGAVYAAEAGLHKREGVGDSFPKYISYGDLKWGFAAVAVVLMQSFMYAAASTQ